MLSKRSVKGAVIGVEGIVIVVITGVGLFATGVVVAANASPFCGVVALKMKLPASFAVVAVKVITFVEVDAVTPRTDVDAFIALANAVATEVAVEDAFVEVEVTKR